ncbi:MAG: transcriptional regulator [Candidatus Competibacteraceae bacterium]|nr:transcriptional regulator [Candidatus Competibacteraceae bacterium]
MPTSQPFQPWLLDQLHNAPQLTLDYLNAALDENDPATFVLALKNVTEAHGGIDVVAARSGLEARQLTALFADTAAPDALTLAKILRGLELRLAVTEPF